MTLPESDAVWIAAIALVPAILTSVLVPYLTNRNQAAKEVRDYERQDAVADKAERAANNLLERQDRLAGQATEAAKLLKTNTEAVARVAEETRGQLKVIHTLVNSNLTAEMKERLGAMKRGLVSLQEIVELKKSLNIAPMPDAIGLIEETQRSISELEITLNERYKATEVAADQAAVAKIKSEAIPP